jgi:cellulose biosynthesis protein BcsQ
MTADTTARTAAIVGATGGAGTTRLTVELATTLAGGGRSVAVLDAAFATQGLADYLPGELTPDLTSLVTDASDAPLSAGLVELPLEVPGQVACAPVRAPFERLARAKTAAAARRFEERIEEAATDHHHVLVDVPPVASNQAIAAVNASDRTAVVAPGSDRGADAVQRTVARLQDLGAGHDLVVATRGSLPSADLSVPAAESDTVTPTSLSDGRLGTAVADVGAALFEDAPTDHVGSDGLFDAVNEYVENVRR